MTCAEVNSHLYQVRTPRAALAACTRRHLTVLRLPQVKTLAEEIGVAFLGLGFQPKWSVADTPAMPKARTPRLPRAHAAAADGQLRHRGGTRLCASTCPRWAAWAWT
jgi:gamma-glutamylcysteine synthetase